MSLVNQLFLVILFTLTVCLHTLCADIDLAIDQGEVKVQSVGKGPVDVKGYVKLSRGDRITTPDSVVANLHFSTGVGGALGEQTTLTVEDKDATGWEKVYLFRGSIKGFGSDFPLVVKTPSTEVYVFHGSTYVYVDQGVTLVIPTEKQGAMVSSSKQVSAIERGEIGIVAQNGDFRKVKNTLPQPNDLLKQQGNIVQHQLSKNYLDAVYELLKIKVTPDVKIQQRILEEKKFKLFFVSPRDALEQITAIYHEHTHKNSMLEEGMELLFAQELFKSRIYNRIIPDDLISYYVMGDDLKELFIKLRVAEKELAKFKPRQIRVVLSIFRSQLVNRLLPKEKIKPKFSWNVREVLAYNSNVTQTPDGQQNVSLNDDITATTILGLTYTGKPRNIGQASIKFGYTDIAHFDESFATRELTSLNLTIKDKYKFKGKRLISSLSPQIAYTKNFLHTATGRVNAFDSMSPQLQMVYKRVNELFAWSDYMIMIHTMGIELRDYRGATSRDFRNEEKDIKAPFTTFMILNLKRFESHMAKTTVILNAKKFDSFSRELDYKNYRINLSHSVVLPRITFEGNYSYSVRRQPEYLFVGARNDTSSTFGFGGKIRVLSRKGTLGVNFKRTVQNSNQNNFDYDSNQSSVYFSYKF